MRRKPNVWELRLYLGRDENAKVTHKYAAFVGGKRDAEKELARLSFELESEPECPEHIAESAELVDQIRRVRRQRSMTRSWPGGRTGGRISPRRP